MIVFGDVDCIGNARHKCLIYKYQIEKRLYLLKNIVNIDSLKIFPNFNNR